ncbi:non-ribosomal peptide synthetase [Rhizobium leguminosarum bv. viciae 248]|uniref:non-ribosomal peptide synthetase n=1 Tax=Rhizobium leguminosarum TaxID=384 RepID=UPI0004774FDA|nr:non-ribosomal peptide synthetase [Rhizobium leguminosarum]QHW23261.1 non-ribosomal peptide synthetase [Rhizobium leguminosarum bv. viciae 248]
MIFSLNQKAWPMDDEEQSRRMIERKRLALLRRRIGEAVAGEVGDSAIPVLASEGPTRASFAQQRLWFLDRLAPGNPFYTVCLELPLSEAIDDDLLQQTLIEITRRHAALRTTFAEHDGQPMQIVHAHPDFPLERLDFSALSPAATGRALAEIAAEETARSFDLERGPLAVARLVTLAPGRYRLFLTLHHIVCDGWSLKVLGHELGTIYKALAAGEMHGLPELAVQYRDFSSWQRATLAGSRMAGHLAYWSRQLVDAPQLAIPTDFRRPTIPTYGGAFVSLSLGRKCAERIQVLCAEAGCTPFMLLLSAWMILLGRQADMEDIIVAAPSAGRQRRELEPMIGFFVNTLVLRGDLSDNPTFRETIYRVRATCLEAYAHDELPFDRLIEEIAPERRGDRNPLAQVIFQLFSARDRTLGSAAPAERQRGTSKFDLRLDLWDSGDGYSGELEYSTDLFEHATAELMAEQFQVLLHDLLINPDRPIAEAAIMSQREFDWLLAHCNHTDRPWPVTSSIVDRFDEIVARHGEATAVSWYGREMTYSEFDRTSDGVAAQLATAGVRPGDRVATLLPRSPEMLVAWLGIIKAGAAYVPLDIDTPAARLRGLLDTVRAAAVVSDASNAATLGDGSPQIILADMARWQAGGMRQPICVGPDDLANVMFTSGSTGKPKAVLIVHRGIVRLAVGQEFWSLRPGERVAQGSNCGFDAATLEVWSALLNGCCLVGLEREEILSPDRLGQRIVAGEIDHLFITTALFHRLAEERADVFAPLKSLITGGSRLEPASVRRVLQTGRPGCFVNAYGPTETTVLGTVWPIRHLDDRAASVPIGTPITNGTAYVLDRLGRLVPRTMPGELFLGGPGVALGYLGDPRQTDRKFGPSPFRAGERLYATGDRVRMRHEGELEFLGRFDDQAKVRGFRVEPEEIAAALRSHPGIAEAQVLINEVPGTEGPTENRIVAFYVPISQTGESEGRKADEEGVAYWRRIYDDVVYPGVGEQPVSNAQFEITGWNDSATGELLREADMAEQVRQTADRVQALGGRDILEFGCGTGLILFKLAPEVGSILGIDISARAIAHVRKTAQEAGLDNVTVRQGGVEALVDFADESFDTVVLNSTVQYFPSAEYLDALIGELLRVTRQKGAIFLGDIRHLGLLETFHAEIALGQADIAASVAAIRSVVARRVEEEQELLLDPRWFLALRDRYAAIGDVTIQLKRGEGHNELARFRYDVVLHLGVTSMPVTAEELDWGATGATIEAVLDRACRMGKPELVIRGIPNARIASAHDAARALAGIGGPQTVGEVHKIAREAIPEQLSPEAVWCACEKRDLSAQIGWGKNPGRFDVLISSSKDRPRSAFAGAPPVDASLSLANTPAHGRRLRRLETELTEYLELLLPNYMLPQSFVRLPYLPLTASGKVDRKALAASTPSISSGPARAPRTEMERRIAAIFCAVLQMQRIGLDDDFFRFGGHSLKATQVVSRIATEIGVAVPLRAVFESATVAGLAEVVEKTRREAHLGYVSDPIAAATDEIAIDAMDDEALDRALVALDEGPGEQQ